MTMNPALSAFNHVVAFEVAKDSLVVYVLPTEKQSIAANKPTAIRKALIAEMRRNAEASLGPLLVVCEATGGYERHVLEVSAKNSGSPCTRLTDRAFAISPGISAFSPKPIRSTPAFSPSMGLSDGARRHPT